MADLPDNYEDKIDAVSAKLTAFAMEHCSTSDGNFDALLFALAAMQFSGSNFSLLPAENALMAMQLTNDRLGRTYLVGRRMGSVN